MTDPQVAAVAERYERAVADRDDPHDWAYAWRSELNRGGFRAVDFLMDEVVANGKCVGCAACVTICPTDVFDYVDEQPLDVRTDACVQCVLCADVCPVLRPPDAGLPNELGYRHPLKDDGYGPYSYEFFARSVRPEIVARTQDGGVVSTILINELERGSIRGAILGDTEPGDPQVGRHKLATTEHDILACGGSRYTYSPNTLALQQAMEQDVHPVAVVGVPCQVDGVRLQQHSSIRMEMNRWYRANVPLVIGLFCSEAFTHESLDALGELFEVDRREIENINIKGKVIVRLKGGRTETMSLKKFRAYARTACLYCKDYAADNADIGVGGIGLDDWSYVVVRTEAGHKAIQQAIEDGHLETIPIEDAPKGKEILIRLTAQKTGRPLPAFMPTLQEREKTGDLDPKAFGDKLAAIERGETV
jgi:coenzyme F420 hydrogenase subunit beta